MWTRQKQKKNLEDESTEDLNPLSQGKQLPRTPPKISQKTLGAIPKKPSQQTLDVWDNFGRCLCANLGQQWV